MENNRGFVDGKSSQGRKRQGSIAICYAALQHILISFFVSYSQAFTCS